MSKQRKRNYTRARYEWYSYYSAVRSAYRGTRLFNLDTRLQCAADYLGGTR